VSVTAHSAETGPTETADERARHPDLYWSAATACFALGWSLFWWAALLQPSKFLLATALALMVIGLALIPTLRALDVRKNFNAPG
jgi:hypothetical protein